MRPQFRIAFMIILMVAMTIIAGSCRSKKKVTERERTKTESVSELKQNTIKNNDVKATSETNIGRNTFNKTSKGKIKRTFEPVDPNKPARANINGEDVILDNTKVTYEDITEDSETTSNDTLSNSSTLTDNSELESDTEANASDYSESQKRASNSNAWSTSVVWQIAMGLGLVALLYLAYKKKTSILGVFSKK